jgi:hypothetical protein
MPRMPAAIRKRTAPAVRRIIEMRRTRREVTTQLPQKYDDIERSLANVLKLLLPIIETAEHDAAMASFVLAEDEFTEPLSSFEMKILACALYKQCSTSNPTFDYADVLVLTDKFAGRSMNITMIYRTIGSLAERRLIDDLGRSSDDKSRPAQKFSVNASGREAFRLSVLIAQQLRNSCDSAAA